MEHKRRNIDKLATLDAARQMYFILAALAIRQSLFPSTSITETPTPLQLGGKVAKYALVGGYLITVLRFSHGISLLHGSVKASVEQSQLPSAAKTAWISVFLVILGIILLFTGDRITSFRIFLGGLVCLLVLDFVLIVKSVIRTRLSKILMPTKRPGDPLSDEQTAGPLRVIVSSFRRRADDASSFAVTLQWLTSDLLLVVICFVFIYWDYYAESYVPSVLPSHLRPVRFLCFGILLIAFAAWDYWSNRHYYFGGVLEIKKSVRFALIHHVWGKEEVDLRTKVGLLEGELIANVVYGSVRRRFSECHLLAVRL